MSHKVKIDCGGDWSGGGSVVLDNALLAARVRPEVFGDREGDLPLFFRNVAPAEVLLRGRFLYMPQNAWPWAGLATTWREKGRRFSLRVASEIAIARSAGALRTGPSVPHRPRCAPGWLSNPLDERFEEALAKADAQSEFGEGYFLSVGSCWSYRNFPTLLRAHMRYRSAGGARPLVLVTAGPRVGAIRALAGEGVTVVAERRSRDELVAIMRAAHAMVFPSTVEASPLTVLEAAALQTPMAVSDIPGHRAALDSVAADGFLVFDALDTEALAARLLELDQEFPTRVRSRLSDAQGRDAVRMEWCRVFCDALSALTQG